MLPLPGYQRPLKGASSTFGRASALSEGKVVHTAVPRLREVRCFIVTPEEVIETATDLQRATGVYLDLLPQEMLDAIPVLQQLQESGK